MLAQTFDGAAITSDRLAKILPILPAKSRVDEDEALPALSLRWRLHAAVSSKNEFSILKSNLVVRLPIASLRLSINIQAPIYSQ